MGWGKLKSATSRSEAPAPAEAATVAGVAAEKDALGPADAPAGQAAKVGTGIGEVAAGEVIPHAGSTNGDGYQSVSQIDDAEVHASSGSVSSILEYYNGLPLDEETQMSMTTREEMSAFCWLGSRACANEAAHSPLMVVLISVVVLTDIGVSINLEPNPPAGHEPTSFEIFAFWLDLVTTFIFTLECLLRIHAMTLKGYLESGFNQLDLAVVVTSWPSILFESFDIDLGPLRAFRVMRVLKEIRFLVSLQSIMGCLSYNIQFISTLLSFILFFIVMFGGLGLELFGGRFTGRCVYGTPSGMAEAAGLLVLPEQICDGSGFRDCSSSIGHTCFEDYGNPHYGYASFDNFGETFLLMFQISTLSNFNEYVRYLNESVHPVAGLFPFLIIFFITMLCFNLFIAVISYSFGQIQEQAHSEDDSDEEEDEEEEDDENAPSSERSSTANKADVSSSDDLDGKDDCADAVVQMTAPDDGKESSSEAGAGTGAGGAIKAGFSNAQRLRLRMQGVSAFMSSVEAEESKPLTSGQKHQLKKATAAQDDIRRALAEANEQIKQSRETTVAIVDEQQKKQREEQQEIEPEGPCRAQCRECQEKVRWLVTTDGFDQSIMAAIVLNTACLAVVHYNQPDLMTDVLNWLEYGFTAVFLFEAAVKIYGLGLAEYFTSGSNVFDFVITLLSFVSLFDVGAGNFSALRTLRVFRALRIARILRRFPVVMRIIKGVLGSLNTVLALGVFLLFVLLLFGVIGMHLYGNRFNFSPKPRSNFDNFWSSVIVLFQVLTGDAWEVPFYDAMRVDEVPWLVTVLFFVLYFLISNLCLLNLFIAAILERLKITAAAEEGTVSEAARAALIMKEALEAEAAYKDLDNAKTFLREVKASGGTAEEIVEAEAMIQHMEAIVEKETEESMELDSSLKFFGMSASNNTLGFFPPGSTVREIAQAIVHSRVYYWLVCVTSFCAAVFPCFKGKFDTFDEVDDSLTLAFGSLILTEMFLKSVADGFLWVFPTIIKQPVNQNQSPPPPSRRNSTKVAPELDDDGTPLGSLDIREMETNPIKEMATPPLDNSKYAVTADSPEQAVSSSAAGAGVGTSSAVEPIQPPKSTNQKLTCTHTLTNTSSEVLNRRRGSGSQASLAPVRVQQTEDNGKLDNNSTGNLPGNVNSDDGIVSVTAADRRTMLIRPESSLEMMKKSYSIADKDGDGDIDQDEYLDYMRKNGVKIETRRPFILTGWNFLDFIIAVAYVIDMLVIAGGSTALRYSWPFRPLRLLSQSSKIQIVVICMMDSVPSLMNVFLLGICMFFVFAVMGLQVFMGTMYTCTDVAVSGKDDCVGMYVPTLSNFNENLFAPTTTSSTLGLGLQMPRVWALPESNFDHIGSSFLALFKVASLNEWVFIMYQGIDAVGENEQPVQNNSPIAAIFFVVFIFAGGIFIFQLFISVIISVYEDTMAASSLTDEDTQARDLERLLEFYSPDVIPPEPGNFIRRWPYNITTGGSSLKIVHENYEKIMMCCIMVNIGFMLSKVQNMSDTHKLVLYIQDAVFTGIFVADILLKLLALGPCSYFSKRWNQFDFVIVTSGVISLFVSGAAVAKIFRVLRVFRLVKTSLQFRMLLSTVLSSLATIAEIVALMICLLLCFSFIGMQTFEGVKYGDVINKYQNFNDFPNAFYTLTVVMYGEWVVLLKDLEISSPSCTTGQDCGNTFAGVYLMTFILLTSFVITNLVVAVILNSFTWLYSMENSRGSNAVGVDDLRKFKEIWQTFDIYSSGSVSHKHLKTIVQTVGEPIGRTKVSAVWFRALQAEIAAMPGSSSGEISFRNLFLILTTKMMGADALCETVDGTIETSSQQVIGLAAIQAVVTKSHQKGAVVRRGSSWFSGGVPRRNSEMTLEEQISEVKREVKEATQMSKTTSDVVNDRENLSMKDKVQLMIREQAVARAEESGNTKELKVAKQRLKDFQCGLHKMSISSITNMFSKQLDLENALEKTKSKSSFLQGAMRAAHDVAVAGTVPDKSKYSYLLNSPKPKQGGWSKVGGATRKLHIRKKSFGEPPLPGLGAAAAQGAVAKSIAANGSVRQLQGQVQTLEQSLREMQQARDGDRQRAGNAEKALEEMKLEMRRKEQMMQMHMEKQLTMWSQDQEDARLRVARTETTLASLMATVQQMQQVTPPDK